MEQVAKPLTNLQLELLKVFSYELSEEELLDIRALLVKHFSTQMKKRATGIWQEKGYSQQDMINWLNDESPKITHTSNYPRV